MTAVAGFVESPRFYPYLSGRANLTLLAKLDGGESRHPISEVLESVQLADRDSEQVGARTRLVGLRARLQ